MKARRWRNAEAPHAACATERGMDERAASTRGLAGANANRRKSRRGRVEVAAWCPAACAQAQPAELARREPGGGRDPGATPRWPDRARARVTALAEIAVPTAAGRFAALVAGPPAGPLALLLHGFPDVPRTLAPLARHLAASGLRVVAPWLRGYAPSPLTGPFSTEQLGADVLALADALAPDRPVAVVGHDWGAVAGLEAAAARPDRLGALVLLAVPHLGALARNLPRHPGQLWRSRYVLRFQAPGAERAVARDGFAAAFRLWRRWSPGYELPPAHREEIARTLAASLPGPLEPYRALVRPPGAARARLRRWLGQTIEVPTLHLHGADDGCVDAALGQGQERWFRGDFEGRVVRGAGHFLHLERPDAVGEAVLAWLGRYMLRPPSTSIVRPLK